MDPISLIVSALSAGAVAALKDTAGTAVKDGYLGLKALVLRHFHGNTEAQSQLAAVERTPAGTGANGALKQHLEDAGAGRDEELLRKAHDLLAQLDPKGAQAGKYNVTVSGGKGVVIGDAASVTMNFND
jgi:hypothetical protein